MKKGILYVSAVLVLLLLLPVQALGDGGKGFGFIDRNGKTVIEPQFDYAYSFSDDRARIFSGKLSSWGYPDEGTYGFIDRDGRIVIPAIYEEAVDFRSGVSAVRKNGKWGAIDPDGGTVVDFSYDYMKITGDRIDAFTGTLNSYGSPDRGTHTLMDPQGNVLFSVQCKSVYAYEWYYELYDGEKYALAGPDGTLLTDYVYDSLSNETETSLTFSRDGKWGYMDAKGNVLISARYDSAGSFADGRAVVKLDGKYYQIDGAGNVLVTYSADYVGITLVNGCTYAFDGSLNDYGSPDEGSYYLVGPDGNALSRKFVKGDTYSLNAESRHWRVKEGNSWYVLDLSGQVVLGPVECDYITAGGGDRYAVKKNDMYALMDEKGVYLTDFIYSSMNSSADDYFCVKVSDTEFDFRKTRWGMSKDQVKEAEGYFPDYTGRLDGRDAEYIGYETTLMGNDVIVAYYIGPDGLYEARYIWTEKHSNDSLYISDYGSVREQLTKKYGSPWYDDENWDTDAHQKYYADKKGDALSYGFLSYETWYYTSRTGITMQMDADNYEVRFVVYYESNSISAPEVDYSDLF